MRRFFGVSRSTTSLPTGDMNAAAAPCRTRDTMKVQKLGLRPHINDAIVNPPIAAANTLRAPYRSLTQPVVGTNTATATR
jgi:hypothetical protein